MKKELQPSHHDTPHRTPHHHLTRDGLQYDHSSSRTTKNTTPSISYEYRRRYGNSSISTLCELTLTPSRLSTRSRDEKNILTPGVAQ